MPYQDLREYLQALENHGLLHRVGGAWAIDPNLPFPLAISPKTNLEQIMSQLEAYGLDQLTKGGRKNMGHESHYHSKKDRIFVRAIAGEYSLGQELERLRALPRVRRGKDLKFNDGPQAFSKHYVEPVDGITQTFHIHIEEYGPGGKSQKHGHVNEAAFYILDGKGYEIHDGLRYDWEAGDVAIVHNNCVHQHFNADQHKPARALVIKTKPMYMFMNMLFQKQVEPRPTEPTPEGAEFKAREEGE